VGPRISSPGGRGKKGRSEEIRNPAAEMGGGKGCLNKKKKAMGLARFDNTPKKKKKGERDCTPTLRRWWGIPPLQRKKEKDTPDKRRKQFSQDTTGTWNKGRTEKEEEGMKRYISNIKRKEGRKGTCQYSFLIQS